MRLKERIPVIWEKIQHGDNYKLILELLFPNWDDNTIKNHNLLWESASKKTLLEKWLKYPNLRLTQLLVTNDIIPNESGMWYYKEDDDLMIEAGLLQPNEILFWSSNYDKEGNPLKNTIFRQIKDLETEHIKKILLLNFEGKQFLSLKYLEAFTNEINLRNE